MKKINGYPNYLIDKKSNIYSTEMRHHSHGKITIIKRKKLLKHTCVKGEYCYVSLMKKGKKKNFKVHHLMADNFMKKPKGKNWVIGHKDDNKHNNKLSNLEWIQQSQNVQDAYDRGLIKGKRRPRVLFLKTDDTLYKNKKKEMRVFYKSIKRLIVKTGSNPIFVDYDQKIEMDNVNVVVGFLNGCKRMEQLINEYKDVLYLTIEDPRDALHLRTHNPKSFRFKYLPTFYVRNKAEEVYKLDKELRVFLKKRLKVYKRKIVK